MAFILTTDMASTLRVVQLDFADAAFPASLQEIAPAELPGPEWARVRVAVGGICGSDLHFFSRATGPAQSLLGYGTLPMDLGHEIVGTVIEAGSNCPVKRNTRVAVDPVIACEARGIKPQCPHCAAGNASTCHNFGSHVLTPGMGVGFTSGLGGGWGDEVLAHRSMLHRLPEDLPFDTAVLHEPMSIAIHGLLRQPPDTGAPVLVAGAGIIGLCAIAAVHAMYPSSPITALAKHKHQAAAAASAGASTVVTLDPGGSHFDKLAEIAGTTVRGGGDARMLAGGFRYVVEAVGTASAVTEALRFADGRATVLLLGAAGLETVDLSPVWFKELALVGSFCHAADGGGHSIDRALDLLAAGALTAESVVTHSFPLSNFRDAVGVALDKRSGAIKVVLTP
jgi:threonine dehydrogenase-like Zn-dependent dehydrogenase